jgi:uncharacterized protein YfeS
VSDIHIKVIDAIAKMKKFQQQNEQTIGMTFTEIKDVGKIQASDKDTILKEIYERDQETRHYMYNLKKAADQSINKLRTDVTGNC